MNYLASHHAGAEVVCNSLKPPVGKGTMVYKVLLSEVAERCWCVQGVLLVPPSIPEEDTHFHEPSELCARTAYHCSSSQNSSTPHHPSAHSVLQRTAGEEDALSSREISSDSSQALLFPVWDVQNKTQPLFQSRKVSKQRENAKHLKGNKTLTWNPPAYEPD